jgi:hypothetical protein
MNLVCIRVILSVLAALLAAMPAFAAPAQGDRLPPMTLTSAAGGSRAVWHKGKITVVTFCAFWCDTWKPQNERLSATRNALRGLPVSWTMVSVDGRWADKGREGSGNHLARKALLDVGGDWTHRLGIRSVPTTLVIDESGTVRFASQGIARSGVISDVVRRVIAGKATVSAPVRLIFDDFPSRNSRLDDQLLDILRAEGIRATFCGDKSRQKASPALVRRALAEGHRVRDAFGTPRGVVDPFDWKRPGRDELQRRVLDAAAPGKTILLHAGIAETVESLPFMLSSLSRRGLLAK